jgi:serine protease Do
MLACALLPAAAAAQGAGGTADVFRLHRAGVVKVQISESSSGAKASVGSGFYVSASGHLITNYHVVSRLITDSARYRAELIDSAGAAWPAEVLALDVVHDLAVLSSPVRPARWMQLYGGTPAQGTRLYSLGHPSDLGLAIVEGTYNGLLEHSLYDRIHFTGSINPGMSGGPTITAAGEVVGVNVSTAGNQLSFLVPGERVAALLAQVETPGYRRPPDLLAELGRQILEYQRVYLEGMLRDGPTMTLGGFRLPTRPAPFFKCWADVTTDADDPYTLVDHVCSTDDYVFISGEQSSGIVGLRHRLMTSRELNRFRFAALLEAIYSPGDEGLSGDEEHFTSFRCRTANVARGRRTIRTALCLRRYRKLDGLYDAVIKTVTLGDRSEGVVSTLTLAGVSYDNAALMARRFLESIAWTR